MKIKGEPFVTDPKQIKDDTGLWYEILEAVRKKNLAVSLSFEKGTILSSNNGILKIGFDPEHEGNRVLLEQKWFRQIIRSVLIEYGVAEDYETVLFAPVYAIIEEGK